METLGADLQSIFNIRSHILTLSSHATKGSGNPYAKLIRAQHDSDPFFPLILPQAKLIIGRMK